MVSYINLQFNIKCANAFCTSFAHTILSFHFTFFLSNLGELIPFWFAFAINVCKTWWKVYNFTASECVCVCAFGVNPQITLTKSVFSSSCLFCAHTRHSYAYHNICVRGHFISRVFFYDTMISCFTVHFDCHVCKPTEKGCEQQEKEKITFSSAWSLCGVGCVCVSRLEEYNVWQNFYVHFRYIITGLVPIMCLESFGEWNQCQLHLHSSSVCVSEVDPCFTLFFIYY